LRVQRIATLTLFRGESSQLLAVLTERNANVSELGYEKRPDAVDVNVSFVTPFFLLRAQAAVQLSFSLCENVNSFR
jgi:hypothetical protein